MDDFPFTMTDIAYLLNLHIRHKNSVSYDVDCPFCGEHKGKCNLNLAKKVFKCNRCGESGGMLSLYGRVRNLSNAEALREIKEALGKGEQVGHQAPVKKLTTKEPEVVNSPLASESQRHRVYSLLFSMLTLSEIHRDKLLKRGFTLQQIEENGYRSTPAFGYRKLTEKIQEAGGDVKGVAGFYQEQDGHWSVHFNAKSCGIMIPVKNIEGQIVGVQIRLDHPYKDRKYMWLSSVNFPMGTSSGSPVHFVGEPGAETVFVTEGPLKGDLAHALSGRTFGCVPGANQYANLPAFLKQMKQDGTKSVYETYDMDKLLKTLCRGDYSSDTCRKCEHFAKFRKQELPDGFVCPSKLQKRENIQRGCQKLRQVCRELELPCRMLTWDMDEDGDWAENVKGVDDYLFDLQQKEKKTEE